MTGKKILWIGLFILLMIVLGTVTYSIIEGWGFLDSAYMTIIVLTTIGFQEVHPLSSTGRIFTMIFSLMGFSILAGSISIVSSSIIEGNMFGSRRRKRMLKNAKRLKNHIIICGGGKVGGHVINSIKKSNKSFVAIDIDEKVVSAYSEEDLHSNNNLFLQGDATKEDILIQAGVERAHGLISCVRDDAVNLFISLTAKKLNPNIKISSYVLDEVNMSKFHLIGTDEVVSGDFVIGERLTASMFNRNISSFLEQTNFIGDKRFIIGDVEIAPRSKFIGLSIREADIFRNVGLLIFAIKKKGSDNYKYNPDANSALEAGDVLITFGSEDDLAQLEKYINGGLSSILRRDSEN